MCFNIICRFSSVGLECYATNVEVVGSNPASGTSSSICLGGGIGRHNRLKICRSKGRAGSIPARGTKFYAPLDIW